MSKICPACHQAHTIESDNFCYRDGTPLVDQPVCECGRSLLPDIDKFCPRCGKRQQQPKENENVEAQSSSPHHGLLQDRTN